MTCGPPSSVTWLFVAVFEAFVAIVQTEGIGGLYRGFWPTLMRDVPEIAIQVRMHQSNCPLIASRASSAQGACILSTCAVCGV